MPIKKKSNYNKFQSVISTPGTLLDDSFGYSKRTMTSKEFKELAKEYIKWAEEDHNALNRSRFYRSRSIKKFTFLHWIKREPIMIEADQIVCDIIAERMIEGAAGCHERRLTAEALRHIRLYSDDEKAIKALEQQDKIELAKHQQSKISNEDATAILKELGQSLFKKESNGSSKETKL